MGIQNILGGLALGAGKRGGSHSSGGMNINNIVNNIDARNLMGPGGVGNGLTPGAVASPALSSSPASSSPFSSASSCSPANANNSSQLIAAALPIIEKLLADLQQLGVQPPGVFSSLASSPASQSQLTGMPPKIAA